MVTIIYPGVSLGTDEGGTVMKMKAISLGIAALFFAASCTEIERSDTELQQSESRYVIYANVPSTKTALDAADGNVTWVKGDVIAVAQRGVATAPGAMAHFTNMSENGPAAAFEGVRLPSHNDIVAVYPASAFQEEAAAGSVVNIPTVQYAAAGALPVSAEGAVIAPSYAYCAAENEQGQIVMNFKNVGGLLGFELPAYLENVSEIVLESASAALTGAFTLSGVERERGTLAATGTVSKTVTLRPAPAEKVFKTGVKYYAAIAPVNAEGVTITLKTIVGGSFIRTSAKFPLNVPVSERRTLQLEQVVANVKVGDCFLADGTWADASKEVNGMVGEKEVLGYVFSTNNNTKTDFKEGEFNSYLSSTLNDVFHGYVISKVQNHELKWAEENGQDLGCYPQKDNIYLNNHLDYVPFWVFQDDRVGILGKSWPTGNKSRCKGFANTRYWSKKQPKLTLLSKLASLPSVPANTSGWYIPSIGDFDTLFKSSTVVKLQGAYWTTSISKKNVNANHFSVAYKSDGTLEEFAQRTSVKKVLYMLAF